MSKLIVDVQPIGWREKSNVPPNYDPQVGVKRRKRLSKKTIDSKPSITIDIESEFASPQLPSIEMTDKDSKHLSGAWQILLPSSIKLNCLETVCCTQTCYEEGVRSIVTLLENHYVLIYMIGCQVGMYRNRLLNRKVTQRYYYCNKTECLRRVEFFRSYSTQWNIVLSF